MKNLVVYFGLFIIFISLSGCASSKEFTSAPKNNDIKIDGDLTDWQDKLVADEDQGIALGFTNDEQNLYLCLTTKNRMRMMQILRNGFTVWVHSPNSSKKTFGIKYPVAGANTEAGTMRQMEGNPMMNDNFDERVNEILSGQTEILIVNEDQFPLTALHTDNTEGIEIKIGFHNDQLVYEMKIALKDFSKGEYCVDANAGQQVELTLQTEKAETGKPGARGMGFGNGMGGQRNGGGNRRPPEGERTGNFKRLDPLDYTIKLNLAGPAGVSNK